MPVLFIQEYQELAQDARGFTVQAGREPALTNQNISFTTTTQSAAFQANTKFIRVVSDTLCYLEFGTNPTATTATDMLIQANTVEFFGVIPGQKVAVVQ